MPYTSATSPTNNAPVKSYTLPGPKRQFVSTETVISGIAGVAVKMGVGDNATVGVKVGDPKPVMGMDGWAVCVNNTTTVCATAVSIRPGTGVATETLEVVHASVAIIKMTTAPRIGLSLNRFPTFVPHR